MGELPGTSLAAHQTGCGGRELERRREVEWLGALFFKAEPSAPAWGTALLYALVCLFFVPPLKNLFFIVVKYT